MSFWKKVKKALYRVFAVVLLVVAIVCMTVLAVFTCGAACTLIAGAALQLASFAPWLAAVAASLPTVSLSLETMLIMSVVAVVGQIACVCGAFLTTRGWPAAPLSSMHVLAAAGDARDQWTRRPYISAGALVVQALRSSTRQVFVEHKGVYVDTTFPKSLILASAGLSI